jgi:hypothetical protein
MSTHITAIARLSLSCKRHVQKCVSLSRCRDAIDTCTAETLLGTITCMCGLLLLRKHMLIMSLAISATESFAFLLRIQEIPGSNLGRETGPRVSVVFLSPSRRMPFQCLKFGHYRFLPCPFQFIIRQPFYHSTIYSLS